MKHIVTFEGLTPSFNASYRKHWREQAAITRQWRTWSALLCGKKPALTPPVEVHVHPHRDDNRLPDTGSSFHVTKAIIDGAVDAGMIPDDGPMIVVALHLHAPRNTGTDQLVVEFEEVEDG